MQIITQEEHERVPQDQPARLGVVAMRTPCRGTVLIKNIYNNTLTCTQAEHVQCFGGP